MIFSIFFDFSSIIIFFFSIFQFFFHDLIFSLVESSAMGRLLVIVEQAENLSTKNKGKKSIKKVEVFWLFCLHEFPLFSFLFSKSFFSLVVPQAANAGMLRLVLVSASNLKCPKGKGTGGYKTRKLRKICIFHKLEVARFAI